MRHAQIRLPLQSLHRGSKNHLINGGESAPRVMRRPPRVYGNRLLTPQLRGLSVALAATARGHFGLASGCKSVAFFRLFACRLDVCPVRWENKNTVKGGCAPPARQRTKKRWFARLNNTPLKLQADLPYANLSPPGAKFLENRGYAPRSVRLSNPKVADINLWKSRRDNTALGYPEAFMGYPDEG